MNETIKTILERRSVRSYTDEPVKKEDLELIVKCGLYAANAMGLQDWHFSVCTNRKFLDEISGICSELMLKSGDEFAVKIASDPAFDNFRGTKAVVFISGDASNEFSSANCGNAAQNMAVAAKSLGLDTCYIASFRPAFAGAKGDEFKKALGVPAGYDTYFALCIGYGAGEYPKPAERHEGLVSYLD